MATLVPQAMKAPFDIITAGLLTFTWAAGATGGDLIPVTGREVILAWNSDPTNPYTFTVTSVVDAFNRTRDITTYSLTAGQFAALPVGLTNTPGWQNTSRQIAVAVSNAAVKWAILTLPPGFPQ